MTQQIDNIYLETLSDISLDIRTSRALVIRKVNSETMSLYLRIGQTITERKLIEGYGKGVVERLSIDLKLEFPEMGLSPRQLWNMKKFYERYKGADQKLLHSVAVLPWGHNLLIMNKTSNNKEAMHYATKAAELGWTRDVMLNYIKANDYAISQILLKSHNFEKTLSKEISNQADDMIKSRYNLGFLGVVESVAELELERKLVDKVKTFILELGSGFTYMGNQYHLEYNNKEYIIDMLFFNRQIRSLVAIELKLGEFKPEYVGKMNVYLSLLDDQIRLKDENPSVGIILCADRDHVDVEIALRDVNKPIGVAEYQLQLPKEELRQLITKEISEYRKDKDNE